MSLAFGTIGQRKASRAPVAFLMSFVLLWWAYGAVEQSGKALHGDVLEAWVWGREFRFGYHQHPPFWAWIAGAWFAVFPRSNESAALLAVLNAAVGLAGAWRLIGWFARSESERRAATLMLLATPFYTFLAFKYNANTIFLSVWPWLAWSFLRALDQPTTGRAIALGLLAGAALMSKYYAAMLLGGCALAVPFHPNGRAWARSPAPWIAGAVCAAACAPHVVWLFVADAPPVRYILARTGLGLAFALGNAGAFLVAIGVYHLVPAGLIVAAWRSGHGRSQPAVRKQPDRLLSVLAFAPLALTVVAGLVFALKISANMAVGVCPLVPLWLMRRAPTLDPDRVGRWALVVALVVPVLGIALSPLIAPIMARRGGDQSALEPRIEMAAVATAFWREAVGGPVRTVAGTERYSTGIAFYAEDAPRAFVGFDHSNAPWVTEADIDRYGLLTVCAMWDIQCRLDAEARATPGTRRRVVGVRAPLATPDAPAAVFEMLAIPPRPSGH